jgi:PLP dependent protein
MSGRADPAGSRPEPAAARLAELAASLAALRARIEAACMAAGRQPDEVGLVAVTKTFPASDVMLLHRLGVADIGENKDQEAAPKAAACAAAGVAVRWHFVGQLQANKAASVAGYAHMVHSVDRIRLVRALGHRAVAAGREISCLVQVNLDPDAGTVAGAPGQPGSPGMPDIPGTPCVPGSAGGRGGADPAQVLDLAAAISAEPGLALAGVMAVAPLGRPARPAFARLREIAEAVRTSHPGAVTISAGMSGDLEDAIAEGATLVRVGTALLGGRRPFVR